MKKKPKEPAIPSETSDTVRHAILFALEAGPRSAREISAEVSISEREVYDHLEHVKKTVTKDNRRLVVTPAECRKCGFVFEKRTRLKKPGKCPVCRGESIADPLFSVSNERGKTG
jgi:predicted Zn-ribbon and HTH transcriptional regulator